MKFLSLFSGIEACSVAWKPLGWECVGFSEIEPFPCSLLAHYYPTVPNLGDITKITEQQIADLGGFDVLVFGSPCFPKGTMVATNTGYKSIEQVRVGDNVLTHTNSYKPVLKTGGKKAQQLYRVKASGALPILCTAEHPFYVRRMARVWDNDRRVYVHTFADPIWVETKDLVYDDFLAIPVIKEESNPLGLSDDDCYILGRYLADGHTRKDYRTSENRPNDRHWQLILSVGNTKLDDTISKINHKVNAYPHTKNTHRVVISSKRLVQIAEQHLGCGAINKFISPTILNLPKDKLQVFLDGYMDGDGSYIKDKAAWQVSTVSRTLSECLVLLVAKLYNTLAMVNKYERPKTTVIQGRTVNQNDTYTVRFKTTRPKQAKYYFDGNLLWTRLKDLELTDQVADVFNLEVADDNTYTANNIIVHNCQDLSAAGMRKGLQDGTRSNLFYEALRIFDYARKHNNCRFALWENVPGAFSSNKGADFAAVVREMAGLQDVPVPTHGWGNSGVALGENGLLEWRVLDAQYFGLAQRRKRVFAIIDTGNWYDRPPILFERESVRGDTPPSREKGCKTTTTVGTSSTSSSEQTIAFQSSYNNVAVKYNITPPILAAQGTIGNKGVYVCHSSQQPVNNAENIVCFEQRYDKEVVRLVKDDVSPTLTAGMGTAGTNYIYTSYTIHSDPTPKISEDVSGTLRSQGGGGIVPPSVVYGFDSRQQNASAAVELTPTLLASGYKEQLGIIIGNIIGRDDANGGNQVGVYEGETSPTLTSSDRHAVIHDYVVRRLTPTECERLMGFPDGYTNVLHNGKPASNSARYKALGNSMATTVMRYIGQQIQAAVDFNKPKQKAIVMTQSPTSLQTFLTCPRQYYAKYVTKEVKFEQNEHATFGDLIHKSIEAYLKHGEPLPTILEPMAEILNKMTNVLVGAETKLAVDKQGNPVEFFSKSAYQRCIVDAIIGDPDNYIICIDWKTGKKRDAQTQHDFIKKCAKAKYPNATIATFFIYLFAGESDRQQYNGELLTELDNNMAAVHKAHAENIFPMVKSGLCGKWCDVISCPNNGRNK